MSDDTETERYTKLEESLEDSEKRSTRQAQELAELKRMRQWKPDNELSAAPVAGTATPDDEAKRKRTRELYLLDVDELADMVLLREEEIASLESRLAETADSRDEWQRTADAFGRDIIELHDEIADLRSRLAIDAARQQEGSRVPTGRQTDGSSDNG